MLIQAFRAIFPRPPGLDARSARRPLRGALRMLLVTFVSLLAAHPGRADLTLGEVGNFTLHVGFYRVDNPANLSLPAPPEASVCPALPPGFQYPADLGFVTSDANLSSILSEFSFLPSAGASAFVELANGNYGLVQDLRFQWNGVGPLDFNEVIIRYDILSATGGSTQFVPQVAPSFDPDGDFAALRIVNGGPGPYTSNPLSMGLILTGAACPGGYAPASESPLRGHHLAALGVLNTGDTRNVTIAFDMGVAVVTTAAGTGVVVQPYDFTTGNHPLTLTFDNVTQQGHTTLTSSVQGPPPPSGFKLGTPPTYFQVETTATFTGSIEACFDYSGVSYGNENNLKLFHSTDGVTWDNVTTSLDTINDIICGSVTSFSYFAICEPDSDDDGLSDADEIARGTDPFDPDTDDDGLLDGSEVDAAMGGSCPHPLVADSDADLILDGTEIANGTNPCSFDTDEDGLSDLIDPDPLVPDVSSGAIEDSVRILADVVEGYDPGLFTGPNANANEGRRNTFASRIRNAANSIGKGHYLAAEALLDTVLDKLDGEPDDWMSASPERDALVANLQTTLSLISL